MFCLIWLRIASQGEVPRSTLLRLSTRDEMIDEYPLEIDVL